MRWFLCLVALCAAPLAYAGLRPEPTAVERAHHAPREPVRNPPRSARPPQFVVVSFDGAGGTRLWPYWRTVARRAHAHFTFFLSGVYLLDAAHASLYHAPRHEAGRSDIGFATSEAVVHATVAQLAAASREGHEIGTHYNGHFCAGYPGSVGEWNAADWRRELDEFDLLVFGRHGAELPFDRAVGGRTPCLEGDLRALYPVLAERGFRYDASQVDVLGRWPRRELGIWSVPLVEIPFVGHSFRVVSMDYNFLANQSGETAAQVERETYLSLLNAFRTSYRGNRAPLSIGNHFETWNRWAYDRALARFLIDTCRLREVRCVSIRELVDWLDLRVPRLALYRH